ncbi:MAG TPA: glycosyltransferase family 39 protein [Polyangiaceae bacterium]|jgi:4-amino-4-deoxy-L-arabinose transferase-like glycosyltransferase|nr:glycosyltransferase family 39 protein [Polyangiaceae bacterium]
MGSLGVLAVLVITLDLEGIGTGGDAIRKWDFVREWFYSNSFRHAQWDHHMARFGVHWVTYLVQRFIGRGPAMYYVPGLAAGSVQVMCVYACGKRLDGRLAGVLGALCLIYFKATVNAASQLMPEVFSATYAMVALYFYLRYYDATGRAKTAWLVAMSVVLFGGYLAKETTVFFYPGFVVALWLAGGKRYRDIGIFVAIIAAGVLLETACYRAFTDYGNRLAVVVANHKPEDPRGPRNFMELFNRFSRMDEPWKRAFYSFLPIGIAAAAFAKSRKVWATYVITAGYLFFLVFMVRQLHPFAVWQSFRVRYFDVTSPFIEVLTGVFLALVARQLVGELPERSLGKRLFGTPRRVAIVVVALVVVAGLGSYSAVASELDDHVLRYNAKIASVATDAYVRGLPIVSTKDKRATWVVYSVLLDDKLLARGGKLPPFDDAKIEDGDRWWLVKEPARYDLDKLRRLLRAHCAVEVTVKTPGPISEVRPMHRLPASCDRLVEE